MAMIASTHALMMDPDPTVLTSMHYSGDPPASVETLPISGEEPSRTTVPDSTRRNPMSIKFRNPLSRKSWPSSELEDAREEREKTQQLLEVAKTQTAKIESIARRAEAERAANHFGEAIALSWGRRQPNLPRNRTSPTQRTDNG
jgi:hypothetical protein